MGVDLDDIGYGDEEELVFVAVREWDCGCEVDGEVDVAEDGVALRGGEAEDKVDEELVGSIGGGDPAVGTCRGVGWKREEEARAGKGAPGGLGREARLEGERVDICFLCRGVVIASVGGAWLQPGRHGAVCGVLCKDEGVLHDGGGRRGVEGLVPVEVEFEILVELVCELRARLVEEHVDSVKGEALLLGGNGREEVVGLVVVHVGLDGFDVDERGVREEFYERGTDEELVPLDPAAHRGDDGAVCDVRMREAELDGVLVCLYRGCGVGHAVVVGVTSRGAAAGEEACAGDASGVQHGAESRVCEGASYHGRHAACGAQVAVVEEARHLWRDLVVRDERVEAARVVLGELARVLSHIEGVCERGAGVGPRQVQQRNHAGVCGDLGVDNDLPRGEVVRHLRYREARWFDLNGFLRVARFGCLRK